MKSVKVAENLSAGGAALRDDRISAHNRCDRSLRQRRYEEAEARRLGSTNDLQSYSYHCVTKLRATNFGCKPAFQPALLDSRARDDGHAI
jgi:hypothetical protein